MKIPAHVVTFAAGDKNLGVYKMFYDYWKHYQNENGKKNTEFNPYRQDGTLISFSEKEDQMNGALRDEIIRVAGVTNYGDFPVEQWSTNPMINWASFAVVSAMIDMILPESLVDSIGLYSEIRAIGWGDSALFTIKPRDLFAVSKSGRGQKLTEIHQQFSTEKTLTADPHQLTVGVSLYKVLAGVESLADLVSKVIKSMEVALTVDVYNAFHAAMIALPSTTTTGLYVSGYTQDSLTRLCEQVSSWNAAEAVIVGTKRALANVLPTDANYRYTLNDSFMTVGYVPTAFGYSVMALPQVAKWQSPFDTLLSNDYLYILSPSSQKFVKVILEGQTLSYANTTFENANLTQNATFLKSWGVGVATSAVAGCIAL
jgi:hypothetical protein